MSYKGYNYDWETNSSKENSNNGATIGTESDTTTSMFHKMYFAADRDTIVTIGSSDKAKMVYSIGYQGETGEGSLFAWQDRNSDQYGAPVTFRITPKEPITLNVTMAPLLPAEERDPTKIEISEDIQEVPAGLGGTYDSVDELKNDLLSPILTNGGYTETNTKTYNIVLMVSEDGGITWVKATEENFPAEGLTITLPYPEGTSADTHEFKISHMFETDMNGYKAGEIETPAVIKTEDGISFTVKGLSPIAIGWTEIQEEHIHSYVMRSDESNHWLECSCKDKQDIETHIYGAWTQTKVPTATKKGERNVFVQFVGTKRN